VTPAALAKQQESEKLPPRLGGPRRLNDKSHDLLAHENDILVLVTAPFGENSMATVSVQYKYLAPNPKSSYKQLFVKGTRLRARVLYGSYMSEEEPRTVEQIAADYKLPVEAVKEAIVYGQSNPPEMFEDYRREAALVEETRSTGQDCPKHLTPEERARIRRKASEPS
jgi:uncharacterized protein (DUF433 family)